MTDFKEDGYVEVKTFTGDTIYYNDDLHIYKDANGERLIGASTYKKRFEKPFLVDMYAEKVANSNGIEKEKVREMWSRNSKISTSFGDAVHLAMEQYWRNREYGCGEKEYHLPKHPILRNIVETFPQKYETGVKPEVFVSSLETRLVGQIDAINIIDEKEKRCDLWDYKTDADINSKKLRMHFIQLSVYADILRRAGWTVETLTVWNYMGDPNPSKAWLPYHENPFDLEKLEKETIMVN